MASKFKKIEHHEHILLRPDSYVGSVASQEQTVWIPEGDKFVPKAIQYNQAFDKIFDEIIVNAYDHAIRQRKGEFPVKNLEVSIEGDRITVRNDGFGIPSDMHPEYGCHVPELIFGTLLTSTNYDDKEERLVAGRNGYGAKLTNLFSSEFSIELVDQVSAKRYMQNWKSNMTIKSEPNLKSAKVKPFTQISWVPDFARFGMSGMPKDMVSLFHRKTLDLASVLGKDVKVHWNGEVIKLNSFSNYAKLYLPTDATIVHEAVHDRLEIVVADNPTRKFMQVSFVNGNHTSLGGSHVNSVLKQITDYIIASVSKKRKGKEISPTLVENALAIWLRCDIVNPSFSGQMKETLKTRPKDFGMSIELPESFLKKVVSKLNVVARLLEDLDAREHRDAKKTDGKMTSTIRGLPNLSDAHMAGTKDSAKCTLILTEGLSALSMVLSGLSKEQRKYFGAFPLKGKIMNVKDMTADRVHANEEITALKKILGLETGKKYASSSSLRYGSLMFMTDQDLDGSHIRGLGINVFHTLWKELLQIPGFISYMATPIVKATKGKETKSFYTMTDYDSWRKTVANNWTVKYYKGLGTSNRSEAESYFKDMNVVKFNWTPESETAIELAFNKGKADDRKEWLLRYDPNKTMNHLGKTLGYDRFVHDDLIHFSYYDLVRSIPNVMDGLKPSQRKILYAGLKRNLVKEIKVAQFAGYVSEHTGYHHGEASLNAAIVSMAQDFVGSNNINLFKPNGQFGTRLQGGSDHASERYIFTELNPIVAKLFPAADAAILEYLEDDGDKIEPRYYAPVIPTILVNGSDGIGTGFSTKILNYNPLDVLRYVRERVKIIGLTVSDWDPIPYYKGFTGTITKDKDEISFTGKWQQVSPTVFRVTELPVGTWTADFKSFLEGLVEKEVLKSYLDMSTDTNPLFDITFREAPKDAEKVLKLTVKKRVSNMHVFDPSGKICKVASPREVVDLYLPVRMDLYGKRRAHQLKELTTQITKHNAIVKFLDLQLQDKLVLKNKPKAEIEERLKFFELPTIDNSWRYLLGMPFSSISKEELENHRKTALELKREFDILNGKTPSDLWLEDLAALEKVLV